MNKLLANYDAARKAIFDHCGVPSYYRDNEIEIVIESWWISPSGIYTYLVIRYDAQNKSYVQDKRIIKSVNDEPNARKVFRGKDVTLVLIDDGDVETELKWFALDNALEIGE